MKWNTPSKVRGNGALSLLTPDSLSTPESQLREPSIDHPNGSQADNSNYYAFQSISSHRKVNNPNGIDAFEMLVQWEDNSTTWESEECLHQDAKSAVFEYWASKGGRHLFMYNDELWLVHEIMDFRASRAGDDRYLVEWVGHPKHTWEPASLLPAHLIDEYWARREEQSGKRPRRMRRDARLSLLRGKLDSQASRIEKQQADEDSDWMPKVPH
ncbi:chromo domain-containing protein [Colletotrichum kahawae]|uniref:Chromo domain-containing protein n=1 Tax=Colletotrichum kahawae TaxID=34407 RepID=A0AAE0CXQ6_COLKA|nr:chromo domain-containing protein [Colletotrichum kahawae]